MAFLCAAACSCLEFLIPSLSVAHTYSPDHLVWLTVFPLMWAPTAF